MGEETSLVYEHHYIYSRQHHAEWQQLRLNLLTPFLPAYEMGLELLEMQETQQFTARGVAMLL